MNTTTYTATNYEMCQHLNGWYIAVKWWWFTRRYFVCSDCGHHERRET